MKGSDEASRSNEGSRSDEGSRGIAGEESQPLGGRDRVGLLLLVLVPLIPVAYGIVALVIEALGRSSP